MRGAGTLLVIFIAIGLLIFGCTATGGPGTGATPGTAGGTGGGNQAAGGAGTGAETGTGAAGGTGTGTGAGTGAATTDYAGMAYAQLLGLGVPLQCDITTTYEGQTTTARIYMKGENEVRSEITSVGSSGSGCPKIISIMKNDKMYMGCEGAPMFEGSSCQWLEFDTAAEPESGASGTGSYETPDYTNVPTTQISCVPWVYDASKFAPPGNACTMDELMQSYQYQ